MFYLQTTIQANAHEGPVYVAEQQRLYFATAPQTPSKNPQVAIQYWELASNDIKLWIQDARMANGMNLSCDNTCLLVCEQGDLNRPAGIARYRLKDKARQQVVSEFAGKPFNSPNKVVELMNGRLIFSDPDYGRRQLFRPSNLTQRKIKNSTFLSPEAFAKTHKPQASLRPSVYSFFEGQTDRIECQLEQPHGLALSPDQHHLYISDTSADDGVGGFDESRAHDIYRFELDALTGKLFAKTHFARLPKGIPDGMVCDQGGSLYCAAGDGVHVYSQDGAERYHLKIKDGAVNLWLDETEGLLFVTTDKEIRLYVTN